MGPQPSRLRDVLARIRASSLSGLMAADRWYGSLYSGGEALSRSLPSSLAQWARVRWLRASSRWRCCCRLPCPLPFQRPTRRARGNSRGGCAGLRCVRTGVGGCGLHSRTVVSTCTSKFQPGACPHGCGFMEMARCRSGSDAMVENVRHTVLPLCECRRDRGLGNNVPAVSPSASGEMDREWWPSSMVLDGVCEPSLQNKGRTWRRQGIKECGRDSRFTTLPRRRICVCCPNLLQTRHLSNTAPSYRADYLC
jgi:hypothetical protein